MTYLRWPKWSRMVVVEFEDEERVHEEEKRSPGRRWTDFVAERTVSHWHLAPGTSDRHHHHRRPLQSPAPHSRQMAHTKAWSRPARGHHQALSLKNGHLEGENFYFAWN